MKIFTKIYDMPNFIEDALAQNKPLLCLALLQQYDQALQPGLENYLQEMVDQEHIEEEDPEEYHSFFVELDRSIAQHRIQSLLRTRIAQAVFCAQKALRRLPPSKERQALEDLLQLMVETK